LFFLLRRASLLLFFQIAKALPQPKEGRRNGANRLIPAPAVACWPFPENRVAFFQAQASSCFFPLRSLFDASEPHPPRTKLDGVHTSFSPPTGALPPTILAPCFFLSAQCFLRSSAFCAGCQQHCLVISSFFSRVPPTFAPHTFRRAARRDATRSYNPPHPHIPFSFWTREVRIF